MSRPCRHDRESWRLSDSQTILVTGSAGFIGRKRLFLGENCVTFYLFTCWRVVDQNQAP